MGNVMDSTVPKEWSPSLLYLCLATLIFFRPDAVQLTSGVTMGNIWTLS